MSKLTKEEIKWAIKVQKALNDCPSKRIGFYTIGDNNVVLFDVSKNDAITDYQNSEGCDFHQSIRAVGANFDECLFFPSPVESAAG